MSTAETQNHPLVSVVIINFNGLDYIEQCIKSVLENGYPNVEVILVDNASSDDSAELAEKMFSDSANFRIIRNSKNIGPSAARNVGAKSAKGEYLIFLDVDAKLEKGAITAFVNVLKSNKTVGACGGKVLLMDKPELIDSIGGYIDYLGFPTNINLFHEKDEGQYDNPIEIFLMKGTCMAVKRHVFEEVGGFDPTFFIIYEENDICWRILLRGYKVIYLPNAVIFHKGSHTISMFTPSWATFYGTRNSLITLIKNYSFPNLVKYLPLHVFIRITEIIFLMLKGKRDPAIDKVKALIYIIKNFKSIWAKRVKVQRFIRRMPDSWVMKFMKRPKLYQLYRQFLQLYGGRS
jgi:GT2 family glycosyltransferase